MPTEQQYMVAKGHTFVGVESKRYREFTPISKDMVPEGWSLEDLQANGTLVEVDVYSPAKKEVKKTTSPWQYDPTKLAKLDVDKLNLMIADIDSKVGAFKTRDEALAQLTKDWKSS